MAYCSKDDLRKGDIPLAARYGDGTQLVNQAADEIDAQIGHIYVTPVTFHVPLNPAHRPAMLMLKNINILIASGRLILDMAAGGEDNSLHAYGRSMWNEGITLLRRISTGEIELVGAEKIPESGVNPSPVPAVINEDPYSLVEGFYRQYSQPALFQMPHVPMRPYDDGVV